MAAVDLSELEELSQPRRLKCGIALALERLKPADRDVLKAALVSGSITHSAIETWLERRSVKVGDKTVGRHRQGKCRCDG